MLLIGQFSNPAIADTVSAVFRSRAFHSSASTSAAALFVRWLITLLTRLFIFVGQRPALALVLRLAIYAALIILVARVAYSYYLQRAPARLIHKYGESSSTDWLAIAARLASQGQYTDAAHALYLALVTTAARRGLVAIHDSKTTGDYLRELRRRADPGEAERFTSFTRSYETVIYGIGRCDAERYESLHAIAGAILERA